MGAHSKVGGHFYLFRNVPFLPNNWAILNVSQMIKPAMSLAAEAKLKALNIDAWEAVYIQQITEQMGQSQPWAPNQTDDLTADSVINNKIGPKCTKTMVIRFHWQ